MGVIITSQDVNTRQEQTIYRDDGSKQMVISSESIYMVDEQPFDENAIEVVFKSAGSPKEGLVSGWASVAVNADGSRPLDWQDDIIEASTLEKAAIQFMMDYRESGVMHKGDATGVIVESIVFTKEKQQSIGIPDGTIPEGWFITVKVLDPEVFEKVVSGDYRMFSIQGSAKRIEL